MRDGVVNDPHGTMEAGPARVGILDMTIRQAWDEAVDTLRSFIGRVGSGRRALQSPNEALQPEAPPPPPPKPPSRRRPTLSAVSGFLSFLVLIAVGVMLALGYFETRLDAPGPLVADKDIFIAPHTDIADIIDKLESEGVIDSPLAFNVALTVQQKRKKIRAGEYLIKAHASLRNVIDTLVSGKQIQQSITIPEGLTSQQVVQRLRDDPMLVGEIRDIPKEGSLLPDTYKFVRGSSRSEILDKMEQLDRKVVEQIWARRSPDLTLRSPYEMVTLASIVEKETGKADERPMVAGIFMNRLQHRMRLQSDPTIVYGLVGGQGTLGHSITRSELDKRTPYNTYQVDGLPPGPIDNPGRAALEAVANPSRTPNLYFVADGTGGHAFAASIDEHNRNVARWREIEREAKGKVDVDKLSPSAVTPAPTSNRRSDALDPAFGGLPKTGIATTSVGVQPSFVDPALSHDITAIAAAEKNAPPRGSASKAQIRKLDSSAVTASLDALGFSMEGIKPNASELLDGPVPDQDIAAAAVASAPAVAGRAGPAALAYAPSPAPAATAPAPRGKAALDAMPNDKQVDLFSDPKPGAQVAAAPMKVPPAHPKIYDASEGTPLDPLKDKSYDLNSGKTIPADFQH
ncbi:Endolytic murein transglycosylase [Beijerinckiaceae bacterium RH AL1]|nr:Endolytic murein transglycosylase [Beijerinckiaceae bacterium RH AL1]